MSGLKEPMKAWEANYVIYYLLVIIFSIVYKDRISFKIII